MKSDKKGQIQFPFTPPGKSQGDMGVKTGPLVFGKAVLTVYAVIYR